MIANHQNQCNRYKVSTIVLGLCLLGVLGLSLLGHLNPSATVAQPNDYHECLMESLKVAKGNVRVFAAALVIFQETCRKKFPKVKKENPNERDLSSTELSNLQGRAGLRDDSRFGGKLYNGNENITITEILTSVTIREGDEKVSRPYMVYVEIPPLSARDFGFEIIKGGTEADYSWNPVGGKGY